MSHHSPNYDDEISKAFSQSELYQKMTDLGATNQFPEGKLSNHDEGEIRFAVITVNGKVVIEFGQSVHWLGMTGEEAVKLGRLLIKRGRKLL